MGAVEHLKTLSCLGLKPATSFPLSGKNCGGCNMAAAAIRARCQTGEDLWQAGNCLVALMAVP